MTRKQLIVDLWAFGFTPSQTADVLGCTAAHVRATLADLGIKLHRFDSTDDAVAWLEANAKGTAAAVRGLRFASHPQATNAAAA